MRELCPAVRRALWGDTGILSKLNKNDKAATILKADNTEKEKYEEKTSVHGGVDLPKKADKPVFIDVQNKGSNKNSVNIKELAGVGAGIFSVGALGFAGNELIKKYNNEKEINQELDSSSDVNDKQGDPESENSENQKVSKK